MKDGERKKSNEQYEAGVKRRVRENGREQEREREERTRLGAMCIGERIHTVRFGGKVFGQVQGDAAAGSLSCFSRSPFASLPRSRIVPFSSTSFAKRNPLFFLLLSSLASFSLSSTIARRYCSFRFVSFFVSGDKPTVRSRRSRRPTAYTRTRQLLRTTRHRFWLSFTSPSLPLPLSFRSYRSARFARSSVFRSGALHPAHSRRCAIQTRGGGFRTTKYVYRKARERVPT